MGAKSYVKGEYDNKSDCWVEENKANQSQKPAFGREPEAINTTNPVPFPDDC